jgi:hypothetical protein
MKIEGVRVPPGTKIDLDLDPLTRNFEFLTCPWLPMVLTTLRRLLMINI